MQTFLPYPSFSATAECLDRQRLGKQRVECLQIMKILSGRHPPSRWRNHPAVKMWEGHEFSLRLYAACICYEWMRRGYKDTCNDKISFEYAGIPIPDGGVNYKPPAWLGNQEFHAAHRSNLLRKAPEHYSRFGWAEPPSLPYVWPTKV